VRQVREFVVRFIHTADWQLGLKLRYLQPARLRQKLRVRASITEFEQRLKIVYEISDATSGRRLTRAHTVQVAVRAATGEMLFQTPAALREKIAAAAAAPH